MNSSAILPLSKEIKLYKNACKKVNNIISKYGSFEWSSGNIFACMTVVHTHSSYYTTFF